MQLGTQQGSARVLQGFVVDKQGDCLTGIVEHVVVMGAPVSTRLERWAMARSVVAGRFVNAYSRRDWVLGLIYRGANGAPCPHRKSALGSLLVVPANPFPMSGLRCAPLLGAARHTHDNMVRDP